MSGCQDGITQFGSWADEFDLAIETQRKAIFGMVGAEP